MVAPTLRILFGAGGSTGKLTAGPPTLFRLLKTNLGTYGVRPADQTDDARPSLKAEDETVTRVYSATFSEPANVKFLLVCGLFVGTPLLLWGLAAGVASLWGLIRKAPNPAQPTYRA